MELGRGGEPPEFHLWFHFPFYGDDYKWSWPPPTPLRLKVGGMFDPPQDLVQEPETIGWVAVEVGTTSVAGHQLRRTAVGKTWTPPMNCEQVMPKTAQRGNIGKPDKTGVA